MATLQLSIFLIAICFNFSFAIDCYHKILRTPQQSDTHVNTIINFHESKNYVTDCKPRKDQIYRLVSPITQLPIGLPYLNEDERFVQTKHNSPKEDSLFKFIPADSPNIFYIYHIRNGKVLDIQGHSKKKNAFLVQKKANGEPCQKFFLKPTSDGTYYCLIGNVGSGRYLAPLQSMGRQFVIQKEKMETEEHYWRLEPVSADQA